MTRNLPASATARQEWSNDRASLIVELRGSAVILATLTGHPDAQMGIQLAAVLEQHLRSPLVRYAFFDADEMTGYHSNLRIEQMRVLMKHRERVAIHVLGRSKLVQMAIAVANIGFNGEVRGYTDRARFLRELNAALAGR